VYPIPASVDELKSPRTGFLEQQTGGNPNSYAAISASGLPELAGLPNTVAGWGLAFLQIRKAVGASNAILGLHISAWASGEDIAYGSVTDALGPQVDKVYAFLSGFGLAPNVTGQQFDLLVGDPLDRDSDYYRLVRGDNRWWDASDTASINSKSFNRYAEWLRLWNQKAQRRWVLWQIPLGNSSSKNVYNNGRPGEGYKDSRAEYFFSSPPAHLVRFAESGVISLLFGAGAGGMSSYGNDTYSDGKLFMQSRAGAFLDAGGLAISAAPPGTAGSTAGSGAGGTGGSTGTGGTGGSGGIGGDSSKYGFEGSSQGWTSSGGMITAVTSSADRAFAGAASLRVAFNGPAGTQSARVSSPATPAAATVTFHVWFPAGSPITSLQPYVLQGSAGAWTWTGTWKAASSLTAGQWNTITVAVPSSAVLPLSELGVQFTTSAPWTGAASVDAVTW
jgi:hypothetical protein